MVRGALVRSLSFPQAHASVPHKHMQVFLTGTCKCSSQTQASVPRKHKQVFLANTSKCSSQTQASVFHKRT